MTQSTSPSPSPTSQAPARRFVSVVVPCLNEELVIGEFVDWCKQGLADAGVQGEIIIVDSSTDRSPQIAREHGARVLSVPKRGLGQAYIDAVPHIRGEYVIIGDCDLTYDFRDLRPFIDRLDAGYEFVMGSRMKGHIEPGAMPALHRYFGTPLTTKILNAIYGSSYSDIHCGMRAMTLDALRHINLQSSSWEYASEMVLKASRLRMRTAEVPIHFYKDREGRQSHHKRSGWFSPWRAGWINLRAMLVFAPDFLLFWPCLLLFIIGAVLVCSLTFGQVTLFGVGLDVHAMLLGVALTAVGHSGVFLALLAKVSYNFEPARAARIVKYLGYDRGMITGGLLLLLGALIDLRFMIHWISGRMKLHDVSRPGVLGLWLVILGFQIITHTLILQMALLTRRSAPSPATPTP